MSTKNRPLAIFDMLARVTMRTNGVEVDPTSLAAAMAVVPSDNQPDDADFQDADWETVTESSADMAAGYYVSCLVGPAGSGAVIEVDRGAYGVYSRIISAPEEPKLFHGYFSFT